MINGRFLREIYLKTRKIRNKHHEKLDLCTNPYKNDVLLQNQQSTSFGN